MTPQWGPHLTRHRPRVLPSMNNQYPCKSVAAVLQRRTTTLSSITVLISVQLAHSLQSKCEALCQNARKADNSFQPLKTECMCMLLLKRPTEVATPSCFVNTFPGQCVIFKSPVI